MNANIAAQEPSDGGHLPEAAVVVNHKLPEPLFR